MSDTTPQSDDTATDIETTDLDGMSGGLNPQPLPPDKIREY